MNNTIHIIKFRPKKFNDPTFFTKRLKTQNNKLLTTQDGKKIKI
jgi:hypothetical protein